MYLVCECSMVMRAVARFESHSEAADYVSRLSNPDHYLIVAEA
jgi:hypothetical protein